MSAHGDELLYSGYINALIDGRARKNDPFGGRDSSANAPLPESIFSIQFVPAYLISFLARTFGTSASTSFIILIGVAAFLASLSVFWLLDSATADRRLAAAGTLFVLCLGGFAGSYGIFGTSVDVAFPVLPFLRRYQPSATFPLFFVFQTLVWCALTNHGKRVAEVCSLLAAVILAALIFSYLYLWTAAVAWLTSVGLLWFCFRPPDRRRLLAIVVTIGTIAAIALMLYIYLVSHRGATVDEQQILILTRTPDLWHTYELLGAVILVLLIMGAWRHRIEPGDPKVLYATSLALLPILVFNQQVLTGRTMQVFHFETFVVNYSTLIGLLIAMTLFWKTVPRRVLVWVTALSFSWGIVAVGLPSRLAFVPLAIANDQRIPVLLRLKQFSKQDGTLAALRSEGQAPTLVFSPSVSLIELLPTWTSQGTLLDMTGVDCGTATREERKNFFYMHLYYSTVESQALRKALSSSPDEAHDELSYVRSVVFGHARIFPALNSHFKPVQTDEIEREVQIYQTYINSFSRQDALKRPITYAVIPVEGNFDFANLDRWYERDAGELVGSFVLYRLKLRN